MAVHYGGRRESLPSHMIVVMLSHALRPEHWGEAFTCMADQHEAGAIKVAFDFR
jgi:hypothetical protein